MVSVKPDAYQGRSFRLFHNQIAVPSVERTLGVGRRKRQSTPKVLVMENEVQTENRKTGDGITFLQRPAAHAWYPRAFWRDPHSSYGGSQTA